MALRRPIWVSVFPLLVVVAACVPQGNAPKAANTVVSPALAQQPIAAAAPPAAATKIITDLTAPRSGIGTATYRCGNNGMITIQNLGTSLHMVGSDATEEFAASPANQSSRYQAATHDAIVIDGREALVMKKGSTPQTCKR